MTPTPKGLQSPFSKADVEALVRSVPSWWHSIDLGHGVVTPGHRSAAALTAEWAVLGLPELRDKTVLDIGAFDGFFSFEAERRQATRVVAVDYTTWSLDIPGYWDTYVPACRQHSEIPAQPDQTPYWRPAELPGKRGFDTAHRVLGSAVESRVVDFMTMTLDESFDIVLYLGVLYHMKDPLGSLERVAAVTKELAVIETECAVVPGHDRALCEFFESDELAGDVTNWWVPNERALVGLCRAAGFRRVEAVTEPPPRSRGERLLTAWQLFKSELMSRRRVTGAESREQQGETTGRYCTPSALCAPLRSIRSPALRAVARAWK
jgi:tRNA (mo5U34)-methyltransferase